MFQKFINSNTLPLQIPLEENDYGMCGDLVEEFFEPKKKQSENKILSEKLILNKFNSSLNSQGSENKITFKLNHEKNKEDNKIINPYNIIEEKNFFQQTSVTRETHNINHFPDKQELRILNPFTQQNPYSCYVSYKDMINLSNSENSVEFKKEINTIKEKPTTNEIESKIKTEKIKQIFPIMKLLEIKQNELNYISLPVAYKSEENMQQIEIGKNLELLKLKSSCYNNYGQNITYVLKEEIDCKKIVNKKELNLQGYQQDLGNNFVEHEFFEQEGFNVEQDIAWEIEGMIDAVVKIPGLIVGGVEIFEDKKEF